MVAPTTLLLQIIFKTISHADMSADYVILIMLCYILLHHIQSTTGFLLLPVLPEH